MTITEQIERFLQVDKLVCANDGKDLGWGYLKLKMWPQYPLGSWRWIKQFFGDTMVIRFCDEKCFSEFATAGRLKEIRP